MSGRAVHITYLDQSCHLKGTGVEHNLKNRRHYFGTIGNLCTKYRAVPRGMAPCSRQDTTYKMLGPDVGRFEPGVSLGGAGHFGRAGCLDFGFRVWVL
jgi:hypothetical protein